MKGVRLKSLIDGIVPRRPLDDDRSDGYLESDKDFVLNNLNAAVRLLERELRMHESSPNAGDGPPDQGDKKDKRCAFARARGCKSKVNANDWCYGCKFYVCGPCGKDLVSGHGHDVMDHRGNELDGPNETWYAGFYD
jgi:hypothetical protein